MDTSFPSLNVMSTMLLNKHIFLPIFLSISIIFVECIESNPKVSVKNGTLEGTILYSSKGRRIDAFKGIPFAQPPIGSLRFHDPLPSSSWKGILSAQNFSNICFQKYACINRTVGDEDCLYLNVFTPKLGNVTILDSLPVMIWFHGGGYQIGHSKTYNPYFLLNHDVVLVTVNYRLGIFGFLSTEDLASPGNFGLKDQALAIRWVHENIAHFNGDPNRVTLFGQSAGAAGVHYHMISPLTKGLFQRGISQSGNSFRTYTTNSPGYARNNSIKIANSLRCPSSNSNELITCLRTKNPVDIANTDSLFREIGCHPYVPIPPVVEPVYPGAFITERPKKLVNSGKFQDVPWMIGLNSQEGALFSPRMLLLKNRTDDKTLDENFSRYAPIAFLYRETFPKKELDNISRVVRDFYFSNKPINDLTRLNLTNLMTDSWFLKIYDEALRDHLKQMSSPIYNYHFAYRGQTSYSEFIGNPKIDYGVCHGDEQQYLFDLREELFPNAPPMNEEELRMADLMTTLWTNFARTGNPTPEITSLISVKWKPVHTADLEYLHIENSSNIHMKANLLSERINFWRNLTSRFHGN